MKEFRQKSSWVITAVIVELVNSHPWLPHFQSRFQINCTAKLLEEGVLTAKRVALIKTPPAWFCQNVKCGFVTTGICMETASYRGIKGRGGGDSEIFTLLSCRVLTHAPIYSFVLDLNNKLLSVINLFSWTLSFPSPPKIISCLRHNYDYPLPWPTNTWLFYCFRGRRNG